MVTIVSFTISDEEYNELIKEALEVGLAPGFYLQEIVRNYFNSRHCSSKQLEGGEKI